MHEIPFFKRLQTRLTLLILVVVAVLAGATTIQVTRGFNQARIGAIALAEDAGAGEEALEVSAVIRSTLINLVAIFLFTLVGATVFSRSLLTEPIASLVRATRELASGNLGVTLPVTSSSELGMLAEAFNQMSVRLAERTRELVASNEALRRSEALLERRVQQRTEDLAALLELSNSTALTLELHPLLEQILERLQGAVGYLGASVFERDPDGDFRRMGGRGDAPSADAALLASALDGRAPVWQDPELLAVPLVVREQAVGVLLLAHRARPLDDDRLQLTLAFASQLAVALENAKLYQQVQEQAAAEERQHLARELHDSVSQALYAILLGTHTAERQLDTPERAREALVYVEGLAQAGIAEMRALIFELRPESLEKEGLVGVLRKQLDAMESRHGLETGFTVEGDSQLAFATAQVLYRVAQEALHNVVKHARASRVMLSLRRRGDRVALTVVDDGIGFDTGADFPGHFGLRSMRERVQGLAGTLELRSVPGEGTTVTVEVPVEASDKGGEPARRPEGQDGDGQDGDGRRHRTGGQ